MRAAGSPRLPILAEWSARSALVVVSVLLSLAVLELGCRLWHGPSWLWHWSSFVTDEYRSFERDMAGRFVRDLLLGWAPRPNFRSPELNYDAQGTRRMPPLVASTGGPIVATGDSFAMGEEVADGESWPAFLQDLLRQRVVNAGVSGYGLDQIVLRAEQQAASLHPAVIVVAFIADDLSRSEMRRLWGGEKPYFTVSDDGTLTLHEVPVPGGGPPSEPLSFWQRALGWSMLTRAIVRRFGGFDEWTNFSRRALPEGTGERLACPLMRRLATLGVPTLVVAQYEPVADASEQHERTSAVLGCATASGLATLDTFDSVYEAVRERGVGKLYRNEHHTAEGNRLVARLIAGELKQRRMLP